MNPLLLLGEQGQRYWLDNLTRAALTSGELRERVRSAGLGGVTSNPSTFHAAIKGSDPYKSAIASLLEKGATAAAIADELIVDDIRDACDVLMPVFESSRGDDGYVSVEVSPHLAHDARSSIEEARRLQRVIDRPNLLIKLPATKAGVEALERLIAEGVSVNVTLLFSLDRYAAAAEAYIRGLEMRASAGKEVQGITSVASFFLSRIDVLIDKLLTRRESSGGDHTSLRGRVAVANAKLAYQRYKEIVASDRWKALERRGARRQRLLWASTGTKNADYSDVMYVEPLIGPETITTLPEETIAAFAEHGRVESTLERDVDDAAEVFRKLDRLDIDFAAVTEQLLNDGIEKFIASHDALLAEIEAQQRRWRDRSAAPRAPQLSQRAPQ